MESNKKNIYLYFGDDDFTIAENIRKEKDSFEKKNGAINMHEIDWNNQNLSKDEKLGKLQNGLMSGSLFSSEKLLIIKKGLFSLNKKKKEDDKAEEENVADSDEKEKIILKYLANPQKEIRIFFVEENLDKRKKIYKELLGLEKSGMAEIKEFSMPADFKFESWIKNRIEKFGGRIKNDALNYLIISLGKGLAQKDRGGKISQPYNLWEANNEIEKLASYCNGKEIEKVDVELLVKSKVDMNIFSLIDSISSKNKNKAALLLNRQIEEGLNENYILTMFVYQFRNLIKIKSLLDQGFANPQIVAQTKMHPFVVQKTVQQCQKFEMVNLRKIYQKLFDADLAIKTGKMNARLVLDLLVASV
jgi:DNA polymerase III subunit delta